MENEEHRAYVEQIILYAIDLITAATGLEWIAITDVERYGVPYYFIEADSPGGVTVRASGTTPLAAKLRWAAQVLETEYPDVDGTTGHLPRVPPDFS